MHELSREDARRIAVRAQLLDAPRPTDLLDVVRQLTLVQVDQTAAVAPSADLVLWSRLGLSYTPADLVAALEVHDLVDLQSMIRPGEDLALYRADMVAWPGENAEAWRQQQEGWVFANDSCRREILQRLRQSGPMLASELPDTCNVPWRSSGWNNNRNVPKLLDLMVERGEVAVAGREGRERLWDLAERVYPEVVALPVEEAARERNRRRLRSLGIARAKSQKMPMEPNDVGEMGEPASVEGVPGLWRVDPAQLAQPFAGRAALLSPFDRLVVDRRRALELFAFDYNLEMFKPAAKRRWGYYALPVLYGDQLVGKLDATADRLEGELRVAALHCDVPFSGEMIEAVDAEIASLAGFLGLELVSEPRDEPRRRRG